MSGKYTRGPWQVGKSGNVFSRTHGPVADAYGNGAGDMNANAALISAAPELLAIAEGIVSGPVTPTLRKMALAAIEKAKP